MDCAAPRHDGEPVPAETGAYLCASCRINLRRDLRSLPGCVRMLEPLLDPIGAGATFAATYRSKDSVVSLPYNDAVSEALSQIRRDLGWWVVELAEQRGWAIPARDSIPAMAGWLAAQVGWVVFRDWAGHMADAFASDRGRARAIIDPRPRAVIPIPPELNYCPPNHGGCGQSGALYATVYQAQDDRRPSMVTCGSCLSEWDTVQWMRLGRSILTWAAGRKAA